MTHYDQILVLNKSLVVVESWTITSSEEDAKKEASRLLTKMEVGTIAYLMTWVPGGEGKHVPAFRLTRAATSIIVEKLQREEKETLPQGEFQG